ncbi:MAG TPA: TatD family hydrolase [Acidimicrobiales bacterium]|nr:TatD family hydrolase [Acidimicrobiales bacterium]
MEDSPTGRYPGPPPTSSPDVSSNDGVEWVDSHSHLQDTYLLGERGPDPVRADRSGRAAGGDGESEAPGTEELLAGALQRAWEAGVRRIVCVGTGPATSKDALALAARSAAGGLGDDAPALWATAGLHPHDASQGTEETIGFLEAAVARGEAVGRGGRLVAVGECGLDYHYEHSPRDVQRRAFAEQVDAACRLGLALVVHARDAWDDLFDVLRAEGLPEHAVLHCFTGGPEEAGRCLDAGMVLSFSGIVTFRNAAAVREALSLCPMDRLMVETDSPFLAPVPHRGKANEPSYVPLVGAAVAEVKGVDAATVATASSATASRVFGL